MGSSGSLNGGWCVTALAHDSTVCVILDTLGLVSLLELKCVMTEIVCAFRSVFSVWRSVVDATAQTAASRLLAAEEYRRLSAQVSRSIRSAKDIRTKRVSRHRQTLQMFSLLSA